MDPTTAVTATTAAVDAGAEFLGLVFTLPNLMIMGAAWALLESASKLLPKPFEGKRGRKLKEGLPVLLTSAFVWIPGAVDAGMAPAAKIFMGAILGMATEWLHQKVTRMLLGRGRADDRREAPDDKAPE